MIIIRDKSGKLLHIVFRLADFKSERTEIIYPNNFLQCAALKLPAGKTFRAHKHKYRLRELNLIAQESWVVISGTVKVTYFDEDNKKIKNVILKAGDSSYTLSGGHTYTILTNAVVYEYKNGPYEGNELDKEYID